MHNMAIVCHWNVAPTAEALCNSWLVFQSCLLQDPHTAKPKLLFQTIWLLQLHVYKLQNMLS